MDQKKIGEFIAKCRKDKNLTQEQLAEKLNVTNKAVSKWETGKSIPDSSIMLKLSNVLSITVNELLSGEKIEQKNIIDVTDENLIKLKKEQEMVTKAARNGFVLSIVLLLIYNVCNIVQLGVENALEHPAFIIMDAIVGIFWMSYNIKPTK